MVTITVNHHGNVRIKYGPYNSDRNTAFVINIANVKADPNVILDVPNKGSLQRNENMHINPEKKSRTTVLNKNHHHDAPTCHSGKNFLQHGIHSSNPVKISDQHLQHLQNSACSK
eukprot:1001023_1